MTDGKSYLTQGAYDRLQGELADLTGPGRTEIAHKIEAARLEGDLKENGGYHAAKEEQGKMESRIRNLVHLLENAVIGEKPADDGVVEPGMVVTVEMFGDVETFLLGSREISDESIHVFSEASPIGAAVNGHVVGDVVTYSAPNGTKIEVTIKGARPYDG